MTEIENDQPLAQPELLQDEPVIPDMTEILLLPETETPEFEAWKTSKILEAQNYLRDAWGMAVPLETLFFKEDLMGTPDGRGPAAWKTVMVNQKFRHQTASGEVLKNYAIWRLLDK